MRRCERRKLWQPSARRSPTWCSRPCRRRRWPAAGPAWWISSSGSAPRWSLDTEARSLGGRLRARPVRSRRPDDVDDQPRMIAGEDTGEGDVEGEGRGHDPAGAALAQERVADEDVVDALAVDVEARGDAIGPPVLRVARPLPRDSPRVLVEGRPSLEHRQRGQEPDLVTVGLGVEVTGEDGRHPVPPTTG